MFARLTPTQLLMETEKAIGSGELWDLHQQLAAGTKTQAEADRVTLSLLVVSSTSFQPLLFPLVGPLPT